MVIVMVNLSKCVIGEADAKPTQCSDDSRLVRKQGSRLLVEGFVKCRQIEKVRSEMGNWSALTN